jgi:hypothetical protein
MPTVDLNLTRESNSRIRTQPFMSIRTPETRRPEPADPLSKLHKMSTTAGVASRQYVAVSPTAVMAALLGVASGLTLFSPLLLVIPAAGVAVAILAWRQVSHSNGTQTGKPLAAAGLTLSLLIGGGVLAREWIDRAHATADARQMESIATKLCDDIKANQFDAALNLFDVNFRARVPLDSFRLRWMAVQGSAFGPLKSVAWNQVLPLYEMLEGAGGLHAVISIAMKFQNSEGRFTFIYRKVGSEWQIAGLPDIFPPEGRKK